jgi:mannose-1-phosphate guanylyltransferase
LRPLTYDVPKPMLPVGHVPMIARLIARLERGGVTDVVLSLGFKPEPFVAAFPEGRSGAVRLSYAVEPEPLDTAGAIRFAAEAADIGETFVVANGDVMTDLDVATLVGIHRRAAAEATLHLIGVDDPSAFGVVDIDAGTLSRDGAAPIRAFVEKPAPGTEPSRFINAGTYVFEPSVIDRIAPGVPSSIERDIFPAIATEKMLFGMATDDYWIDAGRPELYRRANLDLLNGARRSERCDPLGPEARVDATASIDNSIVGSGATVGPGARIIDTVILPGAAVGRDATIRASLVMGTVGDDAEVDHCMIGADGVVDSGESLRDVSRPDVVVA